MKFFDNSTKKAIVFIIVSLCVLSLRKRLLSPTQCERGCKSIRSEFDLLRCLDSCAINSNDYDGIFNVPKERVFLYAFFVLSGFIFSAIMLDQLYINQNKSLINKIVYYYSMITKKDYLKIEQTKKTNEEMGYVQLKSDE